MGRAGMLFGRKGRPGGADMKRRMDQMSSGDPTKNPNFVERRSGKDRRAQCGFPPKFSGFRRRRSSGRRKTDRGGYVDIYDRKSWFLALSVLTLSIFDAIMTILQLQKGVVREANPLMELVLSRGGIFAFFSVKAAITALALAIIMIHKEWRLARTMARFCLACYVLILCYHIYLVSINKAVLPFF
jgi:hypothetical protein